jgi:hypothetical protein
MRRRSWWGIAAISVGAGLALTSPGSLAMAQERSSHLAIASDAAPADPLAIPNGIEKLGRAQYPAIYGGLAGVDDGASITVFLTALDAEAIPAFERVAGDTPVRFQLTSQSAIHAEAVRDKVSGLVPQFREEGIIINRWYPDTYSGHVMIGVANLTGETSDRVLSYFGKEDFVELFSMDKPVRVMRNPC